MIRTTTASAAGKRTTALVEFVDMYPTLCELCGLAIPEHCEGTSFVPLLENPGLPWKKSVFSQYPRGNVMGYAMRTNRYRYVEWCDRRTGEVVATEVYDHDQDNQENVNLADHIDTALRCTLSAQLHAGWKNAAPTHSE
jgi:arylsulfatase A-like enzyme